MKRFILLIAIIYSVAVPSELWAQANLPYNQNSVAVQGPDPSGQLGYPVATVPATGALPWPVQIVGFLASLCVTQCTSPWIVGFGGVSQPVAITSDTSGPEKIGTISAGNSTNTPLAANAIFTGVFESIVDVGSINILVNTNVASSTPAGVSLDWSRDGVNTAFTETFAVTTLNGTSRDYAIPVRGGANFFRIRYLNGGTIQGFFHLQTVYRNISPLIQFPHLYNSSTGIWFPDGANLAITPIIRANYTTNQNTNFNGQSFLVNSGYRGVQFVIEVSAAPAVPGTGGLDLQIKAQDNSGGVTILNAAGPKITAVGAYRWVVYPGANNAQTNQGTATGQIRQIIGLPAPAIVGATVTAGDAQVYNYQLTMELNR